MAGVWACIGRPAGEGAGLRRAATPVRASLLEPNLNFGCSLLAKGSAGDQSQ